ncbi:small ribosomal subunit protein mS39-like isoform X1 [Haliotis cracherodii]|uniref:small ribosomal subunit protein mS39-like isoform X1 n=1 Tax=Haliotis cracherodii TaxID=6455 RepID=UPI0039E91A12
MAASMCNCARRVLATSARSCYRSCTVSTQSTPETLDTKQADIVIPKKKKRDSLSILQALASTVGKDETAPKYMFMDDPFLIPYSYSAKRNFALSKASGRKAARFMVNKYPRYFRNSPADPPIEALVPKPDKYKHRFVNELALNERIEKRRVTDAVDIYKSLKKEGVQISADTHQRLLDLLCVYNSAEPADKLLPEEFEFRQDIGKDSPRGPSKSWNKNGMAQAVFDDMEEKTAEAYKSMIRGLSKYRGHDRAIEYYEEMVAADMPLDTPTYNAIIYSSVFTDNSSSEIRWQHLLCLLGEMSMRGLRPDLETFNQAFLCLVRMKKNTNQERAFHMLTEMKKCEIEPSLSIWSRLLSIVYFEDAVQSPLLGAIVDHLEEHGVTWRHPEDGEFFKSAMAKCFISQKDPELAKRIHKLFNTGRNFTVMSDLHTESLYYNFFFRTLCLMDDIDTVMDYYTSIVPCQWTPHFAVIQEIMRAVELHQGYRHLPQIWSDLVRLDISRPHVLNLILGLMVKSPREPELSGKFADCAQFLIQQWREKITDRRPLVLTAEIMGHIISLLVKGDRFSEAWAAFETYKFNGRDLSGLPGEETFHLLLNGCIQEEDPEKAVTVVLMMDEMMMPRVDEASKKTVETMSLSGPQRSQIEHLLPRTML